VRLPTESEFNVYNSLDEITACKHFCGKNLEEAEALFREGGLYYTEDLMFMGGRAFPFYLQAAVNYLKSEHAAGDADMINGLRSVLKIRMDDKEFSLAIDIAKDVVDYVIANYDKFEVDHTIYGDLQASYKQIKNQLEGTPHD
jgi:hypothetical protein